MPRAKSTPKKNASTRTYAKRKSNTTRSYSYGRYPYRRSYSRNASRASTVTFPQFAVAQIDPFDPASRGVRVPDESTAPSSAFKLFDQTTMAGSTAGTSVANEACCRLFFPNCVRYSKRQSNTSNSPTSGSGGSTWAGDSDTPSKASSVTSTYSLSRPVAHGIRISCPLAPTSVTGYAHVALVSIDTYGSIGDNPDELALAGKLPTTVSDMRELPHYRRVTLASLTQESLTVVNKFLDTTAFRYTSTQSDELISDANGQPKGTFHVPSSWMTIVVFVEGHGQDAGKTVLTVENITHFEGQTKTAGLSSDDSAETANPDAFDGTASAAGKTKASYFGSEQPIVAQSFYSSFTDWLKMFGRGVARGTARAAASGVTAGVVNWMRNQPAYQGIPGVNNVNRLNM